MFIPILKKIIRSGSLGIIDAAGRKHVVGDGTVPRIVIRLKTKALEYTLALNPSLGVGEAYMEGTLTIEEGPFYDFLELAAINFDNVGKLPWLALLDRVSRRLKQYNPVGTAQ